LLHQVAKRKVALAVTGALVASGLLASSALAAPTGSITIGPRISTGQLTAQFYSTSDQYDPTYGYGLSWFPNATLAAPGEQARRPRQAALAGGRLRAGVRPPSRYSSSATSDSPAHRGHTMRKREQLARCGRPPIAATPALAVRASRIGHETRLDDPVAGSPSADRSMLGRGRVGRSAWPVRTKWACCRQPRRTTLERGGHQRGAGSQSSRRAAARASRRASSFEHSCPTMAPLSIEPLQACGRVCCRVSREPWGHPWPPGRQRAYGSSAY
jgi:hypothetical protein